MNVALLLACFVAHAVARTSEMRASALASANPIRKVVNLLQSMKAKIEEEGKREKVLYDQYMCYCKTGASDLQKSIESAGVRMPALASDIKESEAQLVQTKDELKQAQSDRSAAKAAISEARGIREREASAFAESKSFYESTLSAIEKAVAAIEKGMVGAFLQGGAAKTLQKVALGAQSLPESDREEILSFLSGSQRSEYAPSSGEVVGILKQMGDEMSASLKQASSTEEAAIKTFEALVAAKTKEVNALTAAIEAKTLKIGELGVAVVQMKNDLTESETGLIEDRKFLAEMDKNCKTKESEYSEIVKNRAEELVAVSETIKILNDDDALDLFKRTLPSAGSSLVQVEVNSAAVRGRALEALAKIRRTANPNRVRIDLIALALRGKGADFAKVIALIDGMVKILKDEQLDDDHQKEYCLGAFDAVDDKKKGLEAGLADTETAIANTEEGIATVKHEIDALEKGIKALDKSVVDATDQRREEHDDFSKLMASDAAAKELLGFAKNRLNKFYNPKLYKPAPKRDLSAEDSIVVSMGGTLAPTPPPGGIADTGIEALAQVSLHSQRRDAPPPPPETFGPYAKKGEESSGVIAMIDLLIKDLEKEMTISATAEKDAQADYEDAMTAAAEKRASDASALTEKGSTKASLESDLQALTDTKVSSTKELMATLEYIQSLHSECDWLLKYFDVRKEARAGEIDALINAKAVLSGADYSLLQKSLRGVVRRSQQ